MAFDALTSPTTPGLTIETDLKYVDRFPTYTDPFDSSDDTAADSDDVMTMTSSSPSPISGPGKNMVEKLREEPSRHASPQPTSVSSHDIPAKVNGNGYRVLRSATVGYIAPAFIGKADQMQEGEQLHV